MPLWDRLETHFGPIKPTMVPFWGSSGTTLGVSGRPLAASGVHFRALGAVCGKFLASNFHPPGLNMHWGRQTGHILPITPLPGPGGMREATESAAPGPACSKFYRRLGNLLSPGGPRIPPGPSTFSKKVRSFFGSIFGLRFCQFWVPKCRQNPPKFVSKFFPTGVLFLHPILHRFGC